MNTPAPRAHHYPEFLDDEAEYFVEEMLEEGFAAEEILAAVTDALTDFTEAVS